MPSRLFAFSGERGIFLTAIYGNVPPGWCLPVEILLPNFFVLQNVFVDLSNSTSVPISVFVEGVQMFFD